ncbi:helix-turn-helix transcriptional regulator [Actinomycetospora flava]|uniref:Helix-turn-helix transcriptional regulator n=1 Tax=Actinomycetospora flava TaxID=3129232 RepID=A0ABU8M8N5_9PSEU
MTLYLRATYTDLRPAPIDADGFAFWTQVVSTRALSMGRFRHSGSVEAVAEPPSALVVFQTLCGGALRIEDDHGQVSAPLVLLPTWSAYSLGWDDVTVRTTTLDPAEVARVGAELSGLSPDAVAFTSAVPVSAALAQYWSRVSAHVHDDVLTSDTLVGAPLVHADTVRHLATALLATFPNTAVAALDRGDADPRGEPATLRRAVDFMEAHAHEDIGLAEVADAARVGVRSLQLAFRRHRDSTPLEHLRRVRLERAHRDLQAGDHTRGDRVEAIAARWGFGHPGRFSVLYREHYGHSPSDTLRR